MSTLNFSPTVERLLAVTLASGDAFTRAARVAKSSGLEALLRQRADDQERMAAYLREQITRSVPSAALIPTRYVASTQTLVVATTSEGDDMYAFLGACVIALDGAILQFVRVLGQATSLTQRIVLERHRDQMGWTREMLCHLRRQFRESPFPGRARDFPRHSDAFDMGGTNARPHEFRPDGLLSNTMPLARPIDPQQLSGEMR